MRMTALAIVPLLLASYSPPTGAQTVPRVLASTGWTAAYVRAAGVDDVEVLAPYELQHPPEYELKPSDIQALSRVDLVVYAGYENMIARMKEAAGAGSARLLQIRTGHDMQTIRASVRAIAAATGTLEAAERSLADIERLLADWKTELRYS